MRKSRLFPPVLSRGIHQQIAANKSTSIMAATNFTPISDIAPTVNACRKAFLEGKTLPESYRFSQLQSLYKLVDENIDDLVKALQTDVYNRAKNEIMVTEVSTLLSEIAHLMNNLNKYMQPQKVASSAAYLTDNGQLYYTPRGCVCVIGAWNFPLQLLLSPVAGAISAGCTVIMKPSEVAGNLSNLIVELIPKYLDSECYKVITGGVQETTELLKQKFDTVFFTGSSWIGKIVAKQCANTLTPCILELGGQNPVIVDEGVDINTVARRVAWGRWCMNCGQMCIAPEYIITTQKNVKPLVNALKTVIKDFFGDNPQLSADYSRIINANHFERINKILEENKDLIVHGGTTDAKENYIEPTILSNVKADSPVMKDEVFGPILSILSVENLTSDSLNIINSKPKPLSLYVFSNDKSFVENIIARTDSGGVTVNDVVMHFAFPGFPFGGTGNSGMGRYHGWYSFKAFSHEKPVLHKYSGGEKLNNLRVPPFDDWKLKVYRSLTEEKPSNWTKYFSMTPMVAAALGGTAYWLQSRL